LRLDEANLTFTEAVDSTTHIPKPDQLRALSIRQPWAEHILLGEKTVEYRSRPTKVRGRVYVYASLAKPEAGDPVSHDFPRGLIVGTVEVTACDGSDGEYEWQLCNPERLSEPLAPQEQPQPVWFYPFGRPIDAVDLEAEPSSDDGHSDLPSVGLV